MHPIRVQLCATDGV